MVNKVAHIVTPLLYRIKMQTKLQGDCESHDPSGALFHKLIIILSMIRL